MATRVLRSNRAVAVVLQAMVVMSAVATSRAQVVGAGLCGEYQTSADFTQEFVDNTLTAEDYQLVFSSGRNVACQTLRFYPNGTFVYLYINELGRPSTFTGPWEATVHSVTEPASIRLNLPVGELGSPLIGRLELKVLWVTDKQLILTSCTSVLLVTNEQVLAFVPISQDSDDNVSMLQDKLAQLAVPNLDRIRKIQRGCSPQNLRGVGGIGLNFATAVNIFRILQKVGIIPPTPFRDNVGVVRGTAGTYPFAVDGSAADTPATAGDSAAPAFSTRPAIAIAYSASAPLPSDQIASILSQSETDSISPTDEELRLLQSLEPSLLYNIMQAAAEFDAASANYRKPVGTSGQSPFGVSEETDFSRFAPPAAIPAATHQTYYQQRPVYPQFAPTVSYQSPLVYRYAVPAVPSSPVTFGQVQGSQGGNIYTRFYPSQ